MQSGAALHLLSHARLRLQSWCHITQHVRSKGPCGADRAVKCIGRSQAFMCWGCRIWPVQVHRVVLCSIVVL